MLWVRGWFWLAELLLVINFFNQTALYFRHYNTPRFVHIPVVSGPYAWTYVALFWDGAAMVHASSFAARIFANIFIWTILLFGGFFIIAFKDYTIGLELAILSLGTWPSRSVCIPNSPANTICAFFLLCCSSRPRANDHQSHCSPVDLRVCRHGRPRRSLAPHWSAGPPWQAEGGRGRR